MGILRWTNRFRRNDKKRNESKEIYQWPNKRRNQGMLYEII